MHPAPAASSRGCSVPLDPATPRRPGRPTCRQVGGAAGRGGGAAARRRPARSPAARRPPRRRALVPNSPTRSRPGVAASMSTSATPSPAAPHTVRDHRPGLVAQVAAVAGVQQHPGRRLRSHCGRASLRGQVHPRRDPAPPLPSRGPGSGPAGPRGAFFDVDNTIIRGASAFHLARGLYQRGFFGTRDLLRFALLQAVPGLRGVAHQIERCAAGPCPS